jgi:hypothetical protein
MLGLSTLLLLASGARAFTFGTVAGPSAARHVCMSAADAAPLKVGVLAIQGGFAEHMAALERQSGVEAVEVRSSFELLDCDALILPGGESTSIGHSLVAANMLDDVQEFCASKPVRADAFLEEAARGLGTRLRRADPRACASLCASSGVGHLRRPHPPRQRA